MRSAYENENTEKEFSASNHVLELQSVRGLAALVVVIMHCCFYYNYSSVVKYWSETVLNAHAAVVLFYVLSGFVLALSLTKKPLTLEHTAKFLIRRAFRIYPALWVASAVALAYVIIFQNQPSPINVSSWWNASYRDETISPKGVISSFLGFGTELPIPVWSITVELAGSLIMPLVAITIMRGRWIFAGLLTALLFVSLNGSRAIEIYLVDFTLGAAILILIPLCKRLIKSDSTAIIVATAALIGLVFGRQTGGWRFDIAYHQPLPALIEGCFATLLILAIYLRPNAFPLLRKSWAVALGDISYSLYLIHMPIMAFIAAIGGEVFGLHLFNSNPLVATVILITLTLAISLPLSSLSYRLIERPGIKAGRRLISRIPLFNNLLHKNRAT